MKDNSTKMNVMSDKTIQTMVDGLNTKLKDIESKHTAKTLNDLSGVICIPINHYQNMEDGFEHIDFDLLESEFQQKMKELEVDQEMRYEVWSDKQKDYSNDSR